MVHNTSSEGLMNRIAMYVQVSRQTWKQYSNVFLETIYCHCLLRMDP